MLFSFRQLEWAVVRGKSKGIIIINGDGLQNVKNYTQNLVLTVLRILARRIPSWKHLMIWHQRASQPTSETSLCETSLCETELSNKTPASDNSDSGTFTSTHSETSAIQKRRRLYDETIENDKLFLGFMKWKRVCRLGENVKNWRLSLENQSNTWKVSTNINAMLAIAFGQ